MRNNFDLSHLLTITRFKTFIEYVIENRKDIDRKYYKQFIISGAMSALVFTPAALIGDLIYKKKEAKSPVKKPLYVLGHWRSGTTMLQFMLSKDKRFGYPDISMTYSAHFYHLLDFLCKPFTPELIKRGRAMDNMQYGLHLPFEESIIFALMESHGAYPLNYFPKSFRRYANNAYVDKLPEKQRERWIKNYDKLMRRLTYLNDGRPLVLKSPDATSRVAFLKNLYPDAKFVNIYRDPYAVIRSNLHLYDKVFDIWAVETPPDEETMEDWIIEVYKDMYLAFFEEIKALPEGSFYEIKFEELEKDPLPVLEDMYKKLDLGDFEEVRPAYEEYCNSLKGYRKNEFDYPERLIKKVNDNLGFFFEHYGYDMKKI